MNVLSLLRHRISDALSGISEEAAELARTVLPSQDPKFGDYQANCAMMLARQLSEPPRVIAQTIVDRLEVDDICQPPQIAGPGFINLRLRDDWLAEQLNRIDADPERLGVDRVTEPRTYVLDYSSPNVAKPMHVGHIRSTVIGDSLCRMLRFLGHRTISDNHIGDWGTQFGMIIYGYKHFLDQESYQERPVNELGRLYRLVSLLVGYHETRRDRLPKLQSEIAAAQAHCHELAAAPTPQDKSARKRIQKQLHQSRARLDDLQREMDRCQAQIAEVDGNQQLVEVAIRHADIGRAVLSETAKLHGGDEQNRRLWNAFLPPCMEEMEEIYRRLGVSFDHTLGESFYEDRLSAVVARLREEGLAQESDGAICIFLDDYATPMIVQKQDGAYLYATTDLATLEYRRQQFRPDAVLYVVDHRQSLHFEQLFAVARLLGYTGLELEHIPFGTVLGEDHRPFKTRSGDVVGLSGLLDEAVRRAHEIVCNSDDAKPEPELSFEERQAIAEVVGIGALKYADLAQNRESDYIFSYDKMLAMRGNTATYMQYSYARVQSIFARSNLTPKDLRSQTVEIQIDSPSERALGLALVRFSEAIDRASTDYRPNHLTSYLFELASRYAEFFEQCPVLRAETVDQRQSRLRLCDLTARTIKLGLELLGINVVGRM